MPEKITKAPVLILGIGNILLRDEGLGVHIVKAMERFELPDFVELLDGGTSGADLLDAISDRKKLIVIDVLDADVPAGTITRLIPEDLSRDTSANLSLHEFGLTELIRIARILNCAPLLVSILAVKPKDISPGLELSPEIKSLIPEIIDIVLNEIEIDASQEIPI